jgi:predicted RNA-binding protein YlqC (UPF0109 family)
MTTALSERVDAAQAERLVVNSYTGLVRFFTSKAPMVGVEVCRDTLALRVTPDPADVRRLLGVRGATHNALRDLFWCVAERHGYRFHYSLADQGGHVRVNLPPPGPAGPEVREEVRAAVARMCVAAFDQPYRLSVSEVRGATSLDLDVSPRQAFPVPLFAVQEALAVVVRAVGCAVGWRYTVGTVRRAAA